MAVLYAFNLIPEEDYQEWKRTGQPSLGIVESAADEGA